MPDQLSSFLFGVIGGALAASFSLMRDTDNRLFKARLEAYTKAMDLLTDIRGQIVTGNQRTAKDSDNERIRDCMNASLLLASPKLKDAILTFIVGVSTKTREEIIPQWEEVLRLMRKDLGTDLSNGVSV